MPDRAAGKTVDDFNAELLCGLRGIDNTFGRPLANTLGVAVTPDVLRQNRLVTFIDIIADGLAYKMRRDCKDLQTVVYKKLTLGLAITIITKSLIDFEVVAPAGQFKPIIAPACRLLC
jgi:hypothetical protein